MGIVEDGNQLATVDDLLNSFAYWRITITATLGTELSHNLDSELDFWEQCYMSLGSALPAAGSKHVRSTFSSGRVPRRRQTPLSKKTYTVTEFVMYASCVQFNQAFSK